jgi:four helix bundle protein
MGDPIQSHRDLKVWQKSMALVVECYKATDSLPKSELYGLTSQIRRAAVSVASNIAEGKGRRNTGSYIHSLDMAYGSLMEVDTQIDIAARLGFIAESVRDAIHAQTNEVGKMLNGLLNALERQRDLSRS